MITSVHLNYVLGQLPFAERFRVARELGFAGVELPFPYEVAAADYARLLRDNGLVQISLGAPTSNYRTGEPGYAVSADLASAFADSLSSAIAYATEIACPCIHVFSGPLRAGVSRQAGWNTYLENLAMAHDRLAVRGIGLVIEPINSVDFPGYFLDRPSLALTAIRES